MNPRVRSVKATDEYTLELTFTNGETGVYDCRHLLDFGVFRELRDINYFKRARVEQGTVTWPNEQDICPDTLYEDSQHRGAGNFSASSNPAPSPSTSEPAAKTCA